MPCEYSNTRERLSVRASSPLFDRVSALSTPELSLPPTELTEQSTTLSINDLRLLHNWTLHAYKALGNSDEERTLWQSDLPQLALVHLSLMNGILAISSLHLARYSVDREDSLLDTAADHQSLALPA